ncbi:hypothetical protein M514_02567 [Trichuris suis]|uniref:Ig-like domain-containing protein n=1 Tax=Trichuris suis TaxID=68888 RepID=A0A085NNE4_9BILA|nr:hypothetical protein M514_02567 [Trichuris suis]
MDPFIEQTPSILNKPDGSVLFECMVSANPEPEVKWFFKDQELTNSDRYTIKKRKMVGKYACTLQIKQPQNSDQGIYKVVATNSRGKAEKEQSYVMLCTADSMYKLPYNDEKKKKKKKKCSAWCKRAAKPESFQFENFTFTC